MQKLLVLVLTSFALCPPDAQRADLSPYADDVLAVRQSWAEDGTLPPESCHQPYITFQDMPSCDAGTYCVLAFTVYDHRQWTMYIRAGQDDWTNHALIMHESVHWLASCSHYDRTGDRYHVDDKLWLGVLARAEERTR